MDFSAPVPAPSVSFQENPTHIFRIHPSFQSPQGNNTAEEHPRKPPSTCTVVFEPDDYA